MTQFDLNGIQLPGSAETLVFLELSDIAAADEQQEPKAGADLAREMLLRMGIPKAQNSAVPSLPG